MQSLQEKLNHDYSLVEIKQDCITNCMLWSSRNIEIWSARIRRRIYRWVLGSPKSHFFWFDLFGVEPLCTYELVGGDIFFHITEPINRFLGAHHATQPFQEIPSLLENRPKVLAKGISCFCNRYWCVASIPVAKAAGTFGQRRSKIRGLVPG